MSEEERIEIPSEYLEMDPKELAENEEGIQQIMQYLRSTRENIGRQKKQVKELLLKLLQLSQNNLMLILCQFC